MNIYRNHTKINYINDPKPKTIVKPLNEKISTEHIPLEERIDSLAQLVRSLESKCNIEKENNRQRVVSKLINSRES